MKCKFAISMIDEQGYDKDGVPYFYDLYLDLVIYPDGNIIVDDLDELQEALDIKIISQKQYNQAIKTSEKLQQGLFKDIGKFQDFIVEMMDVLTTELNSSIQT